MSAAGLVPSECAFTDTKYRDHVIAILRWVFEISQNRSGGLSGNENFFPLPITITQDSLARLKPGEFAACEKTDGIRYFLLLSLWPETREPFAIAIDRTLTMFEIHVSAEARFFELGTLFDAELIWEYDPKWKHPRHLMLVYDVYLLAGERCLSKPLLHRMEIINRHISLDEQIDDVLFSPSTWIQRAQFLASTQEKIVSLGNNYGLTFKPKAFHRFDMLPTLCRQLAKLNHSSDGLIFTSLTKRMHPGKNPGILKWKFADTIDLGLHIKFQPSEKTFATTLYAMDQKRVVTFSQNDFALNIQPTILKECCTTFGPECDVIVECKLQLGAALPNGRNVYRCDVIKVRTDKREPNSLQTVQHLLEAVTHPVLLQTLLAMS